MGGVLDSFSMKRHLKSRNLNRSAVCPITTANPNHRLDTDGGEFDTPTGYSKGSIPIKAPSVPAAFSRCRQDDADPSIVKPMPELDTDDLIGRKFLLPPKQNGERLEAKGTKKVVKEIEAEDGNRIPNTNFILDIGVGGKVEELITYKRLLDLLDQAEDQENSLDKALYKFRAISGHECPLKTTDPNWKVSKILCSN